MSIPALGSVLTPAGFQVVSAQGQIVTSWAQTPYATIYYVSRSTDGVTFAELASTTSLSYSDTTGVIGTVYWYQVQAGNTQSAVPYSSLPTPSLQAVSLNPGQTTAGNIVLECQQRTNKENSPFYTAQELLSMVNQSYKELYDILVQKFGDDYFVALPYQFTTNQNTQFYPLPPDFYKLLGCEVALNPNDPGSWVTLRKFEFIQRNLWNYPNVYTFYGVTNLRFRLNGNNLYIVPPPTTNQTLRIWYAPRPSQLINSTDLVDAVSGWEEYIVADTCIKMLAKEESDVSIFAGQKEALLKRIEEVAEHRDIGEPETVSDTRMRNFSWSEDGGWGGGNGYGGG